MPDENTFIDFDAMWSEKKPQSFSVRIKGVDYDLPPVVPAKLVLVATRLNKSQSKKSEVSADTILEMAESMFGKKNLDKILETNIDVEELGQVLEVVQQTYLARSKTDAGEAGLKQAPKVVKPKAPKPRPGSTT